MPKIVKRSEDVAIMISRLSGLGITHDEICIIVGVSKPTLYKYYQSDLDVGKGTANAKVSESLFRQATHPEKPNVTACIFWLKCRAKWKETDVIEINNVSQEHDKFKNIIETIRESKLSEEDSNKSTH
ncbi:MAG: hypothetical protein ACR2L5_03010 [Candidatus Actinomarinaceae bacterium]